MTLALAAACVMSGPVIENQRERTHATMLSVDLSTVIQDDFLGVNAVYHGLAFMPEQVNRGMNAMDRAREFDRVDRMGLNIARTWYRPDWACGSDLMNAFDWNSTKMNAFYDWLDEMQKRGVDVALQAGWWVGQDVLGDVWYNQQKANWPTYLPRYTEWVSESLHQLIAVRGYTHIKYLVLMTEPIHGYQKGNQPPDFATVEDWYKRIVQDLHAQLVADGRRTLIKTVGPNSEFGDELWAMNNLNTEIDIYSAHGYNEPGYNGWYSRVSAMERTIASTGKEIWLDEWGRAGEAYRDTAEYGWYLGQGVAASINAGNQTSLIWILFDQQYVSIDDSTVNNTTSDDSFHNGVHRWGLAYWPHDTVSNPTFVRPGWYAYSMLSKYMGGRNGSKAYATTSTESVKIAATRPNGTEYSFLVVNLGDGAQDITVNLGRAINKTLYRYTYDPANLPAADDKAPLLGYDKTFANVGHSFSDSIAGKAVVVYSSMGA
jgi:hypothetical protein